MRVEQLSDSAWIASDWGRLPAYTLASRLEALNISSEIEFVPCYKSLGIYGSCENPTEMILRGLSENGPEKKFLNHRIPVLYDGEDLEFVARERGLTPEQVIELHAGVPYRCFALGFQPGFPYLGYLGGGLSGIPRRASPRTRVPRGSVAIALDQTGIYPAEVPGGWQLLGRTPLQICHVESDYFPIRAGDTVEFFAISREEFEEMKDERL
jgi:inhibitor of KinA